MKKLYLVLTLIFLLICSSLAQSKGGHWKFENNAVDSANWDMNADNGVLVGSATYSQDVPLQEGNSYLFLDSMSSNNFFKIEDSDDLDFTDENIGLSAWIYPLLLNSTHFFINKGVQNSNPKTTNYSLRVSKSKKLEFLIRDSANQAQSVTSSFTIPLDQWTFVAIYYDFAAQKVYMWNDPLSDPQDTLEFSQSFFANDGPLGIGAWSLNDGNSHEASSFKGRIDDVRISGRKDDILASEVTALKYQKMNSELSYYLNQNYPNPFNPETVISFYLPQAGYVTLKIYDNQGRYVGTVLDQKIEGGNHKYTWNAGHLASGIYFYRLKSTGFTQSKKMLLVK